MEESTNRSTQYKGVTKSRNGGGYEAKLSIRITRDRKVYSKYIGSFNTPEEAYIARIRYIDSLK